MSLQFDFETAIYPHRLHGPPVQVDLCARFTLPGGEENVGRIVGASTGEMLVATAAAGPRYGDRVAVYAAELGRFEGDVERPTETGFAINLELSEAKRRRLAAQLVWFAHRDLYALPEARRHKRIVPKMPWTRVCMPGGKERVAQINDVSASGVSVEAQSDISIGDRVAFGVKTALVRRVFDGGFVAEFEEPFSEGEISEMTCL